jgi:phosphate butyryltransferase
MYEEYAMMNKFEQIFQKVKEQKSKRVAVAVAQDEHVLEAIRDAKAKGIADAILIGDREEIQIIAAKIGMDLRDFTVIHELDEKQAALKAVELVSNGHADMLMKGLIDTASLLNAVLNKEKGLRTGRLMSHVAVFEVPGFDRLLLITDAALNMYPDLKAKIDIIKNAVTVAHALGIENPKVAPICAVEVVNLDSPATLDASILSKMNERVQILGCEVDGPLSLDTAISEEAARNKGLSGSVAGKADIILLPSFEVGNVMYKTLIYATNSKNGGILVGTLAPVILTSRSDSHEVKMNSIALAVLVANAKT